ncbi:MAG: HD-GYP domain-containing protein [Treponema sp.]|nr:HD-GYP domain-containing protein [Treponema sp.]
MKLFYNIDFDIAGLIIFVILRVIFQQQFVRSSLRNKRFNIFSHVAVVSGLMDIVTAYTISNADVIPPYLNFILNSIYLYSALLAIFIIEQYVYICISYTPRPLKIAEHCFIITYLILLIINLFTGIIFDFRNGVYEKGPLFLANFIFPLFFLILITICLIKKRSSFTKTQLRVNSTIVLFPVCASILQIFYPEYLLSFFSTALLSLVLLFTLETPDVLELEYLRKNLEEEVSKQTNKAKERQRQIELMILETTQALTQAIDEKDEYTNGHSMRVSAYSSILAQGLNWSQDKIEELRMAALLHDVGKIGIPDEILKKPNKLSEEEYEIIKTHTVKGGKILHTLTTIPGAEQVALYHHERYDGKGYPGKFKGKEIPEFARIVAIADSYDAMNSQRVYRDQLDINIVMEQLRKNSGTQFDPDYLEVFLQFIELGII